MGWTTKNDPSSLGAMIDFLTRLFSFLKLYFPAALVGGLLLLTLYALFFFQRNVFLKNQFSPFSPEPLLSLIPHNNYENPLLEKKPPTLIFGLGPEADKALQTKLVKEASIPMLTSWYNGHSDLAWISKWKHDLIPEAYQKGYILHVITFSDFPEKSFQTPFGPTCGREYPLSAQFLDDMKQLAQLFNGDGQLYVSLFTEFQTYPCSDNEWKGNENYYKTLKEQYHKSVQIFHQYAPNAKVGLSWGGWQAGWDDPGKGGGRSLITHFKDSIEESDFSAFQAMDSHDNTKDIKQMTKLLGSIKKPVMLTHYKPDNGSQKVFDADVKKIFTDSYMKEVSANGLFAISFMDDKNLSASRATYTFIKKAIYRYHVQ